MILEVLNTLDSWVIVVDDGSPDGTAAVVEKLMRKERRVMLLNRGRKMGLGSAYKDGFRLALEKKADIIVSIDADGSHPVNLIPELVKAVENNADVAVASRYVEGGRWSAGLGRMMVSLMANKLARLSLGVKLKDLTSGFRAYRARAVEHLLKGKFSKGYVFQVEILYRLIRDGFKIVEVPFVFTKRASGKSKLSAVEILRFTCWCLSALFSRLLRG